MSTIFFDFETTNARKGSALEQKNRVLMVSWAVDDGPVHNYAGPLMTASEFWLDLAKADTAVAYNAKFEMHWLKRYGFDIDSVRWHDPMLGRKVLLGNIVKPMSMDATASAYGFDTKDPMIDAMMKGGVCPSEMPQARLIARCNRDVRVLRDLHHAIMDELIANEQLHLYRARCDFCVVLTHIEANGMLLDEQIVWELYRDASRALAELERALDLITGGINMKSPDQKANFLYNDLRFPERLGSNGKPARNKPSKQFPNGRPKTDKDTIAWLLTQAKTERQKEFVELQQRYAQQHAAVSKNLEFFWGVCREYNGHFHAQFNQTIAATHRLTSSGLPLPFASLDGKEKSVQFQNMPRAFKKCFKAPEGYEVVELDAMQLEFRVAAFVGQDEQAMKDIADPDFDAHCRTAAIMNDIEYNYFLKMYRAGYPQFKQLRQEAKADTFKPLYGGKNGTPAQEKYYRSFAERYRGLVRQQENWLADVARDGLHRTDWGMVFSFDTYWNRHGTLMNRATHKPVGPQIYNYPVQNLATAEIVPIAITALYRACKEHALDVKFVNTVHDSLICYVRPEERTQFLELAKECFTTEVYEHLRYMYELDFNVPLGMEAVYGSHWGQGEHMVYDDVRKRDETQG